MDGKQNLRFSGGVLIDNIELAQMQLMEYFVLYFFEFSNKVRVTMLKYPNNKTFVLFRKQAIKTEDGMWCEIALIKS